MTILNTAGFSVAYFLFTLFAVEALFALAWGHWQRSLSLQARRLAVAFGVLGGARLLFWLLAALSTGFTRISLEETLAVISLGILIWGFSPYFYHNRILPSVFVTVNTLLALGVLMAATVTDNELLAGTWMLWQLVVVGALFLLAVARKFTAEDALTITAFFVLATGGVIALVLAATGASANNSVVGIRLTELIAYPLLVVAVFQNLVESLDVQSRALASLSEASQEQIQGLIGLFEATKNIVASLDLPDVLDGAAKAVVQALNVDQSAIALHEENEPTLLRMVASCNPQRKGRGEAVTFPTGEQPALKHAMERLRQVEVNKGYNNPQLQFLFAMMGASKETGPIVIQPLVLQGAAIGVLIVGNASSKRPFSATELRLIKTMANQIAVAIDNARRYQGLVKKSQKLVFTLRNHEKETRRRTAALEVELKKSRQETTIMSQRLYEQETLARKSQKELTGYQQQVKQLNQQLKIVQTKFEQLAARNQRLSGATESQKKQLVKLQQAEAELQTLRSQLQDLAFEAAETERLNDALRAAEQRSRKLARALKLSRLKIQKMANMPTSITSPQVSQELENLSCGVLVSDGKGKINRVNAATAKLFNEPGSKLIGTRLDELIEDEAWEHAIKKVSTAEATLVSTTLQLDERIIKATISPITDPGNGRITGSVVILYDATEEFENQQARDEFIASLAQELRTPMTSIIGYVDLLLGESVGMIGDMQRKFLQRVKANIERMDSLLNDLIGIAAIDAGQLEINPTPVDMAEIIEDAIISAKSQFQEKEIQLQLDLPAQMPVVEADSTAMQQVLLNLLSNAAKSTPVGGLIKVSAVVTNSHLTSANATEEEKWLRIAVTDSGGGIAEKDMDRVFDRFYKADRPLIQGLGETGVGLSIVKHLVEAHGGEVWFETEMGRGTTFYFALLVADFVNDPWEEVDIPPLDLNPDR